MSDNKPPVIMGDVNKVFAEPFTAYEKQRLQNVQQSLCLRQRKIVALKKELTKLLGETKKENEARLLGEGGTTLAIARGTYPKTVECTCWVDETTWEVFLTRKDDGREVPNSRRALTDAQINAHKKSRSQLNMFGEGSWTPIRLPELQNDSAQQCEDIPIEELESAALAEVVNLDDVRAMLASDLLAVDVGDDDEDDEDRPRKRKSKGKENKSANSDGSSKNGKANKPELQVIRSPESTDSGPYASDADDDALTSATTIPPSVRVVYVLCVDGAIDTIDADEARHLLDKCTIINGAADKINEDALPEDGAAMDRGMLSTGHNYAIHQLADTSLAGLNTLVLENNGKLLGYVLQDEPRALGADVETTVADVGDALAVPQPMPRPTITMPDTLKAEVVSTLKAAIRNNGGSVTASELVGLFAKESEFDVAKVPPIVSDNLVPICNELVLDGVLVCRGTGDGAMYALPNVVQHDQLH